MEVFYIKQELPVNEQIRAKEVQVIDENGEKKGVMNINDALDLAFDKKLDLVLVSPNLEVPVCKIMNYGKWYIINAEDKVLGRVATEAARLLRGKHKPTYTPNIDVGDHVIITNCAKVVLTGKKLDQKIYRHHSGYIGGMKEISARDLLNKNPEKMMMLAVKGMLPHNSLGRQMLKKLRVYAGAEHENIAQKPEVWEVK